jgi:hypothetical protein
MRMVTFTAATGSVVVRSGDRVWAFGPGSRANLDEQVAPGQTLEQALGVDLHLFTPDATEEKPAARKSSAPLKELD